MHPDIIQIGSWTVHSYGLMIVAAIVISTLVFRKAAPQYGIKPDDVVDCVTLGVLLSLIGARLLYVVLNWTDEFAVAPASAWRVWEGGLSFHGALAGAILAVALFCRRKKIPFYSFVDCCAPGFALGYGIGRIGCLLNGCCFGTSCSSKWGLRFEGVDGYHVPTQIYSSLAGFLIAAVLWRLQQSKPNSGVLFYLFLTLYAAYRFVIEFWRAGVSAVVVWDHLTQAQWLSIVMMVVFGYICIRRWTGSKNAKDTG